MRKLLKGLKVPHWLQELEDFEDKYTDESDNRESINSLIYSYIEEVQAEKVQRKNMREIVTDFGVKNRHRNILAEIESFSNDDHLRSFVHQAGKDKDISSFIKELEDCESGE